jgi:hypothetical protein
LGHKKNFIVGFVDQKKDIAEWSGEMDLHLQSGFMTAKASGKREKAKPYKLEENIFIGGKTAIYKLPVILDGKGVAVPGTKTRGGYWKADCGPNGFNCIRYKMNGSYYVYTDSTGLYNKLVLTVRVTLEKNYNPKNGYAFILNMAYNSNNTACESVIVHRKKRGTKIWSKDEKWKTESYISKKPLMVVREDPRLGYPKDEDKCAPWKLMKISGNKYQLELKIERNFQAGCPMNSNGVRGGRDYIYDESVPFVATF